MSREGPPAPAAALAVDPVLRTSRVVAFAGTSPGLGTTMLAVACAIRSSSTAATVCVDADLDRDDTPDREEGVVDLAVARAGGDVVVRALDGVVEASPTLALLPLPDLPWPPDAPADALERLIAWLRSTHPRVVLDAGSAFGDGRASALSAVDRLVLVVRGGERSPEARVAGGLGRVAVLSTGPVPSPEARFHLPHDPAAARQTWDDPAAAFARDDPWGVTLRELDRWLWGGSAAPPGAPR